ncbi:MAG: type I-U CRISPR-associated protein Csb2 [Cyanobacteria bacterium MAG CAR4_bin_6]|nr:type I-U CRISPR-associated protein Csb2 [Cyanobacteria bacterium MAG CAR4_bin_6]
MKLTLEIEFLTGVCRAARGPSNDEPDWPPQPDRVFSALVSAWGVRGEVAEERAALEWLEKQASPKIRASGHSARTAPDVYVPPNDPKASKSMKYIYVLPDCRPRQPRRFPVAWLDDPTMELVWPSAPDDEILTALNTLASCVGYLGHSASLVRCRFLAGDARESTQKPTQPQRRIYPGRLEELERAYHAKPNRPVISPGMSVFAESTPPDSEPLDKWLVLEVVEGRVPDIRASALICRLLRQALMSGYRKSGLADVIPEAVSGHSSDGQPTRHPHLAIVPMAFVGSPYADSRVFGFALIPPRGGSLHRIDNFRTAWEKTAPYDKDEQQRIVELHGLPLRGILKLIPTGEEPKKSILPGPYLKASSRWASVTPIVLDRHLKRKDDAEIRELVASACENAGLPRPSPERIRVGKHSAVEGTPPARPLAGEPSWLRWKLPTLLKTRWLTHATIDFEQQVPGPVLLGAGRFTGLGLCRSVGD